MWDILEKGNQTHTVIPILRNGDYDIVEVRSKNIEAAIESYKAALLIAPKRLNTRVLLARAYQASNDMQAALVTYNEALELSPNNTTLMILKAGVLESLEQYKAAAEVYEAVLALDSKQKVAANNLAMVLVDYIPSEQSFQRAMEATTIFENTEVPTFQDTRGWVHYQVEDYARALPLLKRAVASDNPQDAFRYHLGMTYYKLNDLANAKTELAAALESGEDFEGKEMAKSIVQ